MESTRATLQGGGASRQSGQIRNVDGVATTRRSGRDAGNQRIRFVEVDGVRIRAAIRGEGRPLLLVMGIGGNIEMWEPFERALDGSGIQTITFDAPGVGESTNWRRPRRMGGLARTVDRLVAALGYDTVDVLGVSFGGRARAAAGTRVPGSRPQARACRHGPWGSGARRRPRPAERDDGSLATPRRYYSPEYFRKVAPTLYGGRIRREPELHGRAGARTHDPPPVAGRLSRAALCDALVDQPSVAAVHRPSHARHGRGRRSDHPAAQRADPGQADAARPARRWHGRRPPLPPGGGGAVGRAGGRVPRASRDGT